MKKYQNFSIPVRHYKWISDDRLGTFTLGGIPKTGTFCLACFDLSKFRKSAPMFRKYAELGQSKQTKQKVPDFAIPPSV